MKKSLLLLFIICFFFSCDSKSKRPAPTVLLSEPQMVEVLTDVQIMESIVSYKRNDNQKVARIKTVGFDTLFSHYGITDSIFRENMTYYNEVEPQTLVRIIDSVEARLLKMKN